MTDPDDAAAHESRADTRRAAAGGGFQEHVRARRSEFEQHIEKARLDFEQANERINERSGRDLLSAILIGLAVGAVVLGSLLFVKWAFLFFAIPVCLLGVFELSRALQAAGRRIDIWAQVVAAATILLSAFFLGHWTSWSLTYAAVALVLVVRLIAQMTASEARRYGDGIGDLLASGLVVVYVPILASMAMVLLRQDEGELWVLTMIAVAVAADTGAYIAGITLGRHPMAPKISPKKTWEGFAGAGLAALLVGVALGVFMLGIPWWAAALLALGILGSATMGDLGESMIKRDMGIKDMSSLLPGHGGALDRLDSILPSAMVALAGYFLFTPLAA